MSVNPLRQRMMEIYPHGMWLEDKMPRDVEIYNWLLENSIECYDFWDHTHRLRCYCFKHARELVMFKMIWG